MSSNDAAAVIGLAIVAGLGAIVLIKILDDIARAQEEITENELRRRIRGDIYS